VLLPLANACEIGAPLSTVNDTVPAGVPAAELIVTVTLPLAPYVMDAALIPAVVIEGFTCRPPVLELAAKLPCAAYEAASV
jgi:hypothetical protein